MLRRLLKLLTIGFALIVSFAPAAGATVKLTEQQLGQQSQHRTVGPRVMSATRTQLLLAEEVRHRLVMLPFYDVFDWLEGGVQPDGTVVLRGQVVRPTLKPDAESAARGLPGVTRVVNEIEVLPVSVSDDRLRVALYNAIYRPDSPLFKYATRAVPPIHIVVKDGRVTLKGAVATKTDGELAYVAARGVPGIFEVTNQLIVEGERAR